MKTIIFSSYALLVFIAPWWLLLGLGFFLPFILHPALILFLGFTYDLLFSFGGVTPFWGTITAVLICFVMLQIKRRLFWDANA